MNLPLFYKNAVQLDSSVHRDLKLKLPEKPLSFASEANLIPALIDEFELAIREMPIAFLAGKDNPTVVFVTGLKPGSNAFLSDEGLWDASYIPAYIRRYPFIVGNVEDGEPVLCIDESFEGLQTKEGTSFFDKDGNPEEAVTRAVTLAESYRLSSIKTDEFAKKLNELGLLEAVSLDATTGNSETISLHGLLVVSQEALSNLDDSKIAELHKSGYLKAIYAHLFSLQSVSKLNSLTEISGEEIKKPSSKKSA